ncbi:GNAT family N-acetyltransferase [Lysinibacillus sp. OL1_EC]|uniref:GNAT family N-acetyltransferase n=1 Tax=unclassified Lysinibacillus TaxID=2636778 RepID=UPI00103E4B45|nr:MULTISPECIES: GNAT family N-acetyltransferase [unclassified Lysinibacillus]MCM0625132.1 GNAT family N-acetyltransferase [Lysinibacillus sp. OL1_EC]TBV87402.1 GNAT family N-acetyltransferase [Lysinibacillus sp. OL1]
MRLIKEENSIWNIEKETIVAEAGEGTFDNSNSELGTLLNQEWWKLIDDNERLIGFGWVDYENDDFEISVAVTKEYQGLGLGSFILVELEHIAKEKGFNETVAIVKESNQESDKMIKWLYKKGYVAYWPGIKGIESKSQEFATNIVKKVDLTLTKQI